MKILLVSSESVFLNNIMEQIEAVYPKRIDYYIIRETHKPLHTKKINGCVYAEKNEQIATKVNMCDVVVINGMTNNNVLLINSMNLTKKKLILWLMWGGDGLYLYRLKNRWYTKQTIEMYFNKINGNSLHNKFRRLYSNTILYEFYFLLINGKFTPNREKLKAIKKVDYIAPVIEDDYFIVKNEFKLKAKYLPFAFGSLKTLIPYTKNENIVANNILLGNSADPSNNHIDVLNLVKDINIKGEIICPLSYGNEKYRDVIIKEGREIFGDKFYPLADFLPIEKYQEIINSCGIVVMNHLRQQAMGNIISALWQGKKVFLNENNYTNNYFERIGVKVHSIQQELKQTLDKHDYKENDEIISNNRKQLEKYYSHKEVLRKTKNLIETITK